MFLFSIALAAEPLVEGGRVSVDGQVITELPAPPRAVVAHDGKLYVLAEGGHILTWSLGATPQKLGEITQPDAVDLFVANGQVWVTIEETRAMPLDRVVPVVVTGTVSTADTPVAVVTGGAKVVRVDNGVAVIDRGRKSGLSAGTELRFLGTESVRTPSLDGAGEEMRELEKVVATGRVRVTEDDRALVDLARGGRVEVGDRVEVKEGAYRYPVAPERLGGLLEAGVVIRPVLALDTVGVALINDAWFLVAFDKPWYAQARVAPMGFGWSSDGNPLSVAGVLSGGYDSRYFSVGLGAGWSMLNSEPGSTRYGYYAAEDGFADQVEFKDVDGAFAVVQEARLGARDGLSISVRNTFLLVPITTITYEWDEETGDYEYDEDGNPKYTESTEEEFVYGGLAMRANVPTGDRTDLFANWSFGEAGEIVVEGGVSTWLRGNGDKGSLGLQVAAGYGYLEGNPDDEHVVLSGPMVSVGGRYRF